MALRSEDLVTNAAPSETATVTPATPDMADLIKSWDGEQVVTRYDQRTGAWIFICLHSSVLGPATGGTRMKVYPSPADGLADAMRLSAAMTLKMAVAGLPLGGAKAVIAVKRIPEGAERHGLLRRYGALIDSLKGSFLTGEDMNMSERDMDLLGEVTPYVLGRSVVRGGGGDPSEDTARGVLHGIQASLAHVFGDRSLRGRTVLVQGVGAVGGRLAGLLREAGADVLVSDVDEGRARQKAVEIGGRHVRAEDVFDTTCDVFAPCAVGGIINRETIEQLRLRCRIVAGSANNQLAEPTDALRLQAAGILYAPDYVINAGGVIHGAGFEALEWSRAEVDRRLEGIGDTLLCLYAEAEERGITPAEAARRLAARQLAPEPGEGRRIGLVAF